MATFQHGTDARLVGNGMNLGAVANSFNAEGTIETSDATPLDSSVHGGARMHTLGTNSGTYSAAGFLDDGLTESEAFEMIRRVFGAESVIVLAPSGDTAGKPAVGIVAGTTKASTMQSVGETIGFSIEGHTNNGFEPGVCLLPLAAHAPAVEGSAVNAGAASTGGLSWFVAVCELDGTDAEFVLQHSTDGNTWVDVDSVTFTTGETGERRVIAPGTLNQYRRVIVDPTSDCTSVEAIVALVAK